MTGENVVDFFEHHGVKGMKWGVRKDRGHEGQSAKTKKIAKLDQQFENVSLHTVIQLHNRAAQLSNDHDVARINNKPEYKDKDFSRDSPLRQKYYKEHQDAFVDNLEKAAGELGTNASGTKRYHILEGADGAWNVYTADVKHAAAEPFMRVEVAYDAMGHIVGVGTTKGPGHESVLHQSALEEFFEHHGVKGMRWGVHRKSGSGESEGKSSSSAPHPTAHLSDKELKDLVDRMRLNQQYSEMVKKTNKSGATKTLEILATVGKSAATVATAVASAKKLHAVLSAASTVAKAAT